VEYAQGYLLGHPKPWLSFQADAVSMPLAAAR
jgi:hypothetical protein